MAAPSTSQADLFHLRVTHKQMNAELSYFIFTLLKLFNEFFLIQIESLMIEDVLLYRL